MNKLNSITKPLTWFMALLMVAAVTGCGGSSSGSPAPVSPTLPGVGTGLNGLGKGPAPVIMGTAGNFRILAQTRITNVPTSVLYLFVYTIS